MSDPVSVILVTSVVHIYIRVVHSLFHTDYYSIDVGALPNFSTAKPGRTDDVSYQND